MKEPFSTYAEACIGAHYPKSFIDLQGGLRMFVADTIGSFGVQLGGAEGSSWIDVNFERYGRNGLVEVRLIDPQLVKETEDLGSTALIDTVRLVIGDKYEFGRIKYPEVDDNHVSRHHVRLNALEGKSEESALTIEVEDLGTTNGTFLKVVHAEEEQQGDESFSTFNRDYSTGDSEEDRSLLDSFIAKYESQALYRNLSPADLNVCMRCCLDMRSRFGHDKKRILHQMQRLVHPDLIRHAPPDNAYKMYLLILEELGLDK